jgi:hypothetical protein
MDHLRDSKPFKELMDQLCAALNEGFKASDAMKDAYWNALRDVPFAEIKANVQRIIATATPETKIPRPASLRNRPAQSAGAPPSAAQEKAARDSMRRWREMKQRDPVAFEIEFRSARAFTELARCSEEDPGHEEWLREYRKWEALRYAPRADQEAGVQRLLRA